MKHGMLKGVTNPSGRNFKTVSDGRGGYSVEPIGKLSVFTGTDSWGHYFSRAEKRGELELVSYSRMTPIEKEFIRGLEHVNHLNFPLRRFKTVNTRQYGKKKVGREGKVVRTPNEDYGATNIFLYLGDDPTLGKKQDEEREGQARHRRIRETRALDFLRSNHKNVYFSGRTNE